MKFKLLFYKYLSLNFQTFFIPWLVFNKIFFSFYKKIAFLYINQIYPSIKIFFMSKGVNFQPTLSPEDKSIVMSISSEDLDVNNISYTFQKIAKIFELDQIKIQNVSFVESSFNGKTSKIDDLKKILLFLFLFQKDQFQLLSELTSYFFLEKKTFKLITEVDFEKFSENNNDQMEIFLKILANYDFFTNDLLELASEEKIQPDFMGVILPILNYCYYEIPRECYINILSTDKFTSLEKLKWIDLLLKNSKEPKCKSDSINNTSSLVFTKYIKKTIFEFLIQSLAKENTNLKEFFQKTIFLCLKNNFKEVPKIFAEKIRDDFFTEEFLSRILKENHFEFFNKNLLTGKIRCFLTFDTIWSHILVFLESPTKFLQGIFMLCQIQKLKKLKAHQHLKLISFLKKLAETDKILFFMSCVSPILVLVMISLLTLRLSKMDTPFLKIYKKFALFFKSCALDMFLSLVCDANECEIILFKITFPSSQKLIDILFSEKEFFLEILTDEIILRAMKNSIKPKFQYDYNLLAASSCFLMLKSSFLDYEIEFDPDKEINLQNFLYRPENVSSFMSLLSFSEVHKYENHKKILNFFNFLKKTQLKTIQKNNHIYQFETFVRSIFFRNYLDFFFYVIGFIYIFASFNILIAINFDNISEILEIFSSDYVVPNIYINSTAQTYNFTELSSNFNPLNDYYKNICINNFYYRFNQTKNFDHYKFMNDILSLCSSFTENKDLYAAQDGNFTVACFFSLLFGLRFLLTFVYQYKNKTKVIFDKDSIEEIIIALTTIVLLFLQQNLFSFPVDSLNLIFNSIRHCCCFIIFLFWIRLIGFVDLIQSLAVRIEIIRNMIFDLMSFFIILIFVLFCFATTSYLLFNRTVFANSSFTDIVFSLLGASFANFNLNISDPYSIAFSILLVFFMFFVAIILFNLLIAILSNTYCKMIERGNMEYGHILYKTKRNKKYNKNYGGLILFPSPINFLLYFSLFNYLLSNNQRINNLIVKIGYSFILILFTLVFIITHLVLIPASWLKVFYDIIFLKYRLNKAEKKPKLMIIFLHFIIWLIGGILYLVLLFFVNDLPLFFESAYKFCDNKTESLLFEDFFFHPFVEFIGDLHNENVDKLNFAEFIKRFLERVKKNAGNLRLNWFHRNYLVEWFCINQEIELLNYFQKLIVKDFINISQIKNIIDNLQVTEDLKKKKKVFVLLNIVNLSSVTQILEGKRNSLKNLS